LGRAHTQKKKKKNWAVIRGDHEQKKNLVQETLHKKQLGRIVKARKLRGMVGPI